MLSADIKKKFIDVCREGNEYELVSILSSVNSDIQKSLILTENYLPYRIAVTNGHDNIVRLIFDKVKVLFAEDYYPANEAVIPLFEADKGSSFKEALLKGYIDVAKTILDEEYLFFESINLLENDARCINILWQSKLKDVVYHLFYKACQRSVEEMKLILNIIPKEFTVKFILSTKGVFCTSTIHNKVTNIKFLLSLLDTESRINVIDKQFPECILEATKVGRCFEAVKFLLESLNPKQQIESISYENYSPFIYAADQGDLNILQLFWDYIPASQQMEALTAFNFAAYRWATLNQHKQVLEFLESVASNYLIDSMRKSASRYVDNPRFK
jgi:hypothetical protein